MSGAGAEWLRAPGVLLEDKGCSLAIHYRQAADRDAARSQIEEHALRLTPMPRLIHGKCVLNLVPPGAQIDRSDDNAPLAAWMATLPDPILGAIITAVRHAMTHIDLVQKDTERLQKKTGCCVPAPGDVAGVPCCVGDSVSVSAPR